MSRSLRVALFAVPLAFAACATVPKATGVETGAESAQEGMPAEPAAKAKEAAPKAKQAPRPTGVIPRAELNRVLDEAPGRFLQHVQTEPRFVGGRFRGWRLASFFPGDDRFVGVDLRAGDVVTAVNGKPIEQPEQLMDVWESLRFERALVVSVERDGQPRQLRFDIRE